MQKDSHRTSTTRIPKQNLQNMSHWQTTKGVDTEELLKGLQNNSSSFMLTFVVPSHHPQTTIRYSNNGVEKEVGICIMCVRID